MSLHQRVMIKMAQEEKDNKKVDFAFDLDKLEQESFLHKLSSTVKRIGEYHDFVGDEGR